MPEYVINLENEEEKEYEVKPEAFKSIARYDSKIQYIDTLNYAKMLQDNQSKYSLPETNYTQEQGVIEEEAEVAVNNRQTPQDVDAVEANNKQLMEEAISAAAQQDVASEEFDAALDAIATNRFNAIVANDRKQAESYLNAIKQADPNNYEKNLENIRKTKFYEKCLEKWRKYYSDIKEQCVNAAKTEIEAHAKSEAISEAEQEQIKVPVDSLNVNKYVPKQISTNMVADKNLTKTISGLLIDKLYNSLDESNDMYAKLKTKQEEIYLKKLNEIKAKREKLEREYIENIQKAETDKEKFKLEIEYKKNCKKLDQEKFDVEKSFEIFKFRNDLSEKLQHSHNKLYPKKTGVYAPAYKLMQKNVANHAGDMTEDAISDLYILKMKDEIIPEIAEKLALRVQEVLLTNTDKTEFAGFNYDSKTVEKILERITDKAMLYQSVVDANNAVNGKYAIADMLLAERKAMLLSKKNNVDFVYDAEKFANMKESLEENRQNNVGKMNQIDYIRLGSAIDVVEEFEKKLAAKEQISAEDTESLKVAFKDLESVRDLAKVEEKLNDATSKKLFGKNDGIQLVFDYLTADYIESASNAQVRGSLSAFDYTQEDVEHDIEKSKNFLEKNILFNPIITSELMNRYASKLQAMEDRDEHEDLLNKVVDYQILLEEDEMLQETGNPTVEDNKKIKANQIGAMATINEVTKVLGKSPKLTINKDAINEMNLGE